jgi:hypothetical protein
MSKMTLTSPEEIKEFGEEFLPPAQGFAWRLADPREEGPLHEPTSTSFGVHVGHFREGWLMMPLDPLLLELMKVANLPFSRLALNVIRIISLVSALNKKLEINQGLK